MASPKFSIGIDLGTTNCAMSFVPLAGEASITEVFHVPQWETTDRLIENTTLPSFLYLPTDAEATQLHGAGQSVKAEWVCGRIARTAKSWLGHHAVDRRIAFLPWGSDEIPPDRKISPIRASALLLNYLRGAWDSRFPDDRFDAQEITVTVPASFDAVAQRLTLDAAAEAGFPKSVRLLEEPQAAFYRWLESHKDPQTLWNQVGKDGPSHVLVVDIGGGTSDFSLFEIRRQEGSSMPAIRRVAVSDHLLLGGDNIDLALARLLEPRLAGVGETLSGSQWQDLVARCRDLKEACLAADGEPAEEFPVTLPGRGSGLFAGSLSAKISRAEVMSILLDGFYPECAADARPTEADAALREWGLPYAADSGITRYLADFLLDLPAVDAILFNGGSLYPQALRQRIRQQIGDWQETAAPTTLDNPEPDLAVARGAARYGSILHHRSARIQAGAARSIYLEVHQGEKPTLVCVLPRGSEPEEIHAISHPGLELQLNRPVRFQCYYSTRHDKDRPGALVPLNHENFHRMPPLQTIARLEGKAAGERLAVSLTAKLTELGLLHLECVSADPTIVRAWPLAFNLRAGDAGGVVVGETDPGVDPDTLDAAKERIVSIFSARFDTADPLTSARLLKSLEDILDAPKSEWNLMLVRALWTTLKRCIPCRVNSLEHEEAWLILAGFFLRPGFGAELDPVRIDDLWEALKDGPIHPGKQIRLQRHILHRRLAGGLDRERQQLILDAELPGLRQQKKSAAELIRLVGSLERIDLTSKLELIDLFLTRVVELSGSGGYAAPYLVSLGQLLNRTPLYTGAESVVPPDLVSRAFESLRDLDWKSSPELSDLFLRAARVTDDRALDVPKPVRKEIARKLNKAKVAPHKVTRIEEFIPIDRSEQVSLYGESLPPGLLLGGK